ncbi:hypothetical protein Cgig2_029097 [Carnegiea gigantea]|uniref:Uncharacterized protein n=1 Tax=Carnegiea gigantea TaxID=171969 RepID=A0A9Q1JI88_9CARY|nr:hypothetical protein Cgig2_029097 [Carnegiea gigantea]
MSNPRDAKRKKLDQDFPTKGVDKHWQVTIVLYKIELTFVYLSVYRWISLLDWDVVSVSGSFKFPKGKESRQWFRETLDASWRSNKYKLKREKFKGKPIDEGANSRPIIIPEDQWRNAVQFLASTPGQIKYGKEPDKLELFEATHKPKWLETKLDDASAAALVCHLLLFFL